MIDANAALKMVQSYITTIPLWEEDDPWVVIPEKTEDHSFAWVFYWIPQSLLRRSRNPPIAGNYPIIVKKDDGLMFICAGPYPPRHFVDLLRSDPKRVSGLQVRLSSDG